jgi:hypothetical protein
MGGGVNFFLEVLKTACPAGILRFVAGAENRFENTAEKDSTGQ